MDALLAICQAIHPLSEPLQLALRELVRRQELPKRHRLLELGQVAQRLYFLETGVARGFYLEDGKEMSSWYMKDGDFVISTYSFFSQRPSLEYVELLADSLVWSLTHQQLQTLYRQFPEFNFVGRVLTEKYYVLSEQRAQHLRMHSATERYEQLLRDFSARLPQTHCLTPWPDARNC